MTKCKSCNADIEWIKTPAGKNHPIDAGGMKVWVKNGENWVMKQGYSSHFATCPNADQHRRQS